MKKNSMMVKSVLMSMITAGAFVFGLASCSDEDVMANESANPEMEHLTSAMRHPVRVRAC